MIIFNEPRFLLSPPTLVGGSSLNHVCEKILMVMNYPHETFAEASARLGYGNMNDEKTRQWYYDHNVYIMTDEEIQQNQTINLQA